MAGRFALEIVQGPDQGKRFPLSEPGTTIGRHAEANIVLGDGQASRRHARLDLHDDQLWLRDLGSANGTFVNGTQVRQPFALSPGDTILIGNTTLRVVVTQESAATVAPAQAPLPPGPVLDAVTRLGHSSGTAPTRAPFPGAMQVVSPGMTLNNRYELGEQVGQGGFARVYLATDLLLKRRIAVKVLNSDLAEADGQSFLDRFAQEAQSIASLDHPNILGIHDFGEALGTVYLVMPYVEGGTLGQHLRSRGQLDPASAGDYLRQAAAALDYAHRRHLVHRDIKPQNMLLRAEDGRLLLSDFGIAKVVSSTSAHSSTGVMGTIAYMAPEQLQGRVTPATDIYALGCVLFQLLTGQLPFTGPTEQVMFGHLSAPIPTLLERGGGHIPPGVQPVLERALAKQPEARFRTAGELATAFDAAIGGAAIGGAALHTPTLGPGATVPVTAPFADQPPTAPPFGDQPQTVPVGSPYGSQSPPPFHQHQTQLAAPVAERYGPLPNQPQPPMPPPTTPPTPSSGRMGRRALLVAGAVAGLALLGGGAGAAILSQRGGTAPTLTTGSVAGQTGSAVPAASSAPGPSSAPPTPTPTTTPVPGINPALQSQSSTATALAGVAQGQAATATALAQAGGSLAATATAQAQAAIVVSQGATATAQTQAVQSQAATATAQAGEGAARSATATAQARATQSQVATATAQAAQKAKDAEDVVKAYYDAVNRRDFPAAWALASSKWIGTDYNKWKAGYDNTLSVALTVESTTPDGSNHEVFVRIVSQERDGTSKRFAGYYLVGLENGTLKMIGHDIKAA